MAALTNYSADNMLDLTLSGTAYSSPASVYLSLMTVAGDAAGGGTEVSGGGYVRKPVTFGAPSTGAVASDALVDWTPVHTGSNQTVVGWTVWDDLAAGNMLAFHTFPEPTLVLANTPLSFVTGRITVDTTGVTIKDYLANKWLDHLFRNTSYSPPADCYMGHYTATPTASTDGTEVADSGYDRQIMPFDAASSGSTANNGDVEWLPLVTDGSAILTGWAISDMATIGNQLMFGAWAASETVEVNEPVKVLDGTLVLTVV